MKIVNVLSSHYDQSSVKSLIDVYEAELTQAGHQVVRLDLTRMAFDPVMKGDDFNQFRGGELPPDLVSLQSVLRDADQWGFFFPIWWYDVPAQIKGFLDRVLSKGFAYDYGPQGSCGLLKVKKVLMVSTLGNQRDAFHMEWEKAFELKYRQGIFGYCGIPAVEVCFFYNEGSNALERHAQNLRDLARQTQGE